VSSSAFMSSSAENPTDGEDRWSVGDPEDDVADMVTASASDGGVRDGFRHRRCWQVGGWSRC